MQQLQPSGDAESKPASAALQQRVPGAGGHGGTSGAVGRSFPSLGTAVSPDELRPPPELPETLLTSFLQLKYGLGAGPSPQQQCRGQGLGAVQLSVGSKVGFPWCLWGTEAPVLGGAGQMGEREVLGGQTPARVQLGVLAPDPR